MKAGIGGIVTRTALHILDPSPSGCPVEKAQLCHGVVRMI